MDTEVVLRQVIRFLLDGYDNNAASLLLSCKLWLEMENPERNTIECWVNITAPRKAYDVFIDKNHPDTQVIKRAFEAVIDRDEQYSYKVYLSVEAQISDDFGADWRAEAEREMLGSDYRNQAAFVWSSKIVNWNELRFRSNTEVKIAIALDRAGTLFLPNCSARLGSSNNRGNEEADFLICHQGKWGILEVDGPHHTPERAAKDHEKVSRFQNHGIRFVRRYDAERCYREPDGVVKDFLENLIKMYG